MNIRKVAEWCLRGVLYGFPIYFIALEWTIRIFFKKQGLDLSALSSSLFVGGMTMLLPSMVPLPAPPDKVTPGDPKNPIVEGAEHVDETTLAHDATSSASAALSPSIGSNAPVSTANFRIIDVALLFSSWICFTLATLFWILGFTEDLEKIGYFSLVVALSAYFLGILHTEYRGIDR